MAWFRAAKRRKLLSVIVPLAVGIAPTLLWAGPRQDAYNAAQAAFDKRDWAAAIVGFSPLLPASASKPLQPSEAVIATRLARSLVHVDRMEEAQTWAERAIAGTPPGDTVNLGEAWTVRGDTARFTMDYTGAMDAYRRAEALGKNAADQSLVLTAAFGFALTAVTMDPVRVANDLDPLLNDPQFQQKNEKGTLADLQDLRARAAMNMGDLNVARYWIDKAVLNSGGVATTNVNQRQVMIRGDAGIIYRLRNDDENTRRFLTFTGAGHLPSTNWIGRFDGQLPVCGAGLNPDDSAVVQFSIADNGKVVGAMPIYASRKGDVGLEFARAVGDWRWNPSELQNIDLFWRATMRFELRCASREKPDALGLPYWASVRKWAGIAGSGNERSWGPTPDPDDPRLAKIDVTAVQLSYAQVLAHGDDALIAAHAVKLLDALHAPPVAYAALIVTRVAGNNTPSSSLRSRGRTIAVRFGKWAPDFLARFPDDPSAGWLLIEWGLALEDAGDFGAAAPILNRVLAMPVTALPMDAPIRRVALLHIALIKAQHGDVAGAQASLAASGLTAEQCALFDTHPIPASVQMSNAQFPEEARRWNFEGYVKEDFDIRNDGRVQNVRTIIAYPPYIFGPSTERAVRDFRYVPPSVNGAVVGCSGRTEIVNYRISH